MGPKKSLSKYKSLSLPVKASLWFFVSRLLQKGISVITTPIFTRLLTTAEYGEFTTFNSWQEMLSIFITLRLYTGVFMQGLVRYDNDRDEYTSALEGLTTTLGLLVLAIYLPFRSFWNGLVGMNTFLMVMVIISSWATALYGFWSARQRVDYKYKMLLALTVLSSILKPLTGIIGVLLTDSFKVEARVGTLVAVEVLVYGWSLFYYMKKGKKFYDREFWKHAIRFNVPLIPHYLSQSMLSQSDRVMIRRIVGKSQAGIYGLAYQVSWMLSIVNQSINSTLEPWLYRRIREGDTRSIANVSYTCMVLVGVSNLALIAIAPEAVSVFAPEQYHEAIWVIPPLAASVFLTFDYTLFAVFEFYYERTRLVMIASVAGALVNIGLNAILIPMFGYLAAGYTTLIGYFVYIVMHYAFMRKVQIEEMGGVRVYDPRVLVAMMLGFGAVAAGLTLSYPFLPVRFLFCLVLLAVMCWKRGELVSFVKSLRGNKAEG